MDSDCASLDTDCLVGRCTSTGMCRAVPRPNGTVCDDGDFCSMGDSCFRGACRAGPPRLCPPSPDPCRVSECDSNAGSCVLANAPDGTMCDDNDVCSFPDECMGGLCMGTPQNPLGDACPGLPLAEMVGTQVETANNVCAVDDGTGTCGLPGGRDLVYRLTLTDPRRIRAETVAPAGAAYDTVVHVRDTCNLPPSELVCDDNSGTGTFSRIDRQFDPGTYFFFADARSANAQGDLAFELEVDPQNTCANPTPMVIPALNATNRFVGSTNGATNDFQAPCGGGQQSSDHVYTFTITQQMLIRFETEPVPNGQYDTALALHAAPCTPGMPMTIACDDDGGQFTLSRIEAFLQPGTYFLTVDGFGINSSGVYSLAVTRLPTQTTVTFPNTGDARLTQIGTTFSQDGDFVEGIRTLSLSNITSATIDLRVTNNLTCAFHRTGVLINGTQVGTIVINPGQAQVMNNFTFPAISGPSYSLRLETLNDVPNGCGSIDYPNGVSTWILGF